MSDEPTYVRRETCQELALPKRVNLIILCIKGLSQPLILQILKYASTCPETKLSVPFEHLANIKTIYTISLTLGHRFILHVQL